MGDADVAVVAKVLATHLTVSRLGLRFYEIAHAGAATLVCSSRRL
jgi:hypothetical protein